MKENNKPQFKNRMNVKDEGNQTQHRLLGAPKFKAAGVEDTIGRELVS